MQSASTAVADLELELAPGERLLWSGRPVQGLRFRPLDWALVPFSLAWLGFALFWESVALHVPTGGPGPFSVIFPLFGLPFIVVGLYIAVGRFFLEARRRAQTAYGITDRRVLTVVRGRSRRVRSLAFTQISDLEMVERRDGVGTIRMATAGVPAYVNVGRNQRLATWSGEVLDLVPRVREPYEVLQRVRGDMRQAG